ncbi:hypothetical protein [Amycolatopsis pithecellobii]|uniref:DUF385 domain-containing protein n=1 Tax=Amycolatopsis pithecellobii TaxID=664692 RepID=A0A6N7Z8X9_9PSEU|nr:hypothetical protein [Amycolatopsis pithecellobii]MTD57356.1 hypothetical protein [Amycolatopsis pithecellobii]
MTAIEVSHPPAALIRLVNRVLVFALPTPLGGPARKAIMVLRFTGRKSGRRYAVPVTAHRADGTLMSLTGAPWRVNFRGGRDLDVVFEGRTTPMRGVLVEQARTVAEMYRQRIDELGPKQAQRLLGIKITVPHLPTVEELTSDVEREHLSIIWLKPRDAG